MDTRRRNVFIVGMDPHNRRILDEMPGADRYRFHPVLDFDDIYGRRLAFDAVLAAAHGVLDAVDVPIDAIIGFWDFPVSTVVPLLRERYGLPTAPVEQFLMCEHKYWSRMIQREVIDEYPPFALVDPFSEPRPPAGLRFPMWVKPVKSFASVLAFGVADPDAYAAALARIREDIGRIGDPFEALLERADLPAGIAGIGGHACLAEEAITGRQLTVEGYRYHGRVVLYGVIDSVRYDDSPSFLRFQYPSTVPADVVTRLEELSRRVVERIGLESMTFNIEYFWDPGTDAITLLEINPRHSQSHAELFAHVDGMPNHEVMVRLALGEEPDLPHRAGAYRVAAKCFVRRFTDGVVRRHPLAAEIDAIERIVPGSAITLTAHAGDVLSRMGRQDSYSYELASVYIGAEDEPELLDKFDRIVAALPYEVDDIRPSR